jgi:hypothetical protein
MRLLITNQGLCHFVATFDAWPPRRRRRQRQKREFNCCNWLQQKGVDPAQWLQSRGVTDAGRWRETRLLILSQESTFCAAIRHRSE